MDEMSSWDQAVPRARRLLRGRDGRLALGVLLVAAAVVLGTHVAAGGAPGEPVWVAVRTLAAGDRLGPADVRAATVRLGGAASAYLPATSPPPTGEVLRQSVGAGALLPRAAVGPATAAPPLRWVTVPVAPGHFPPALASGDRVDVYLTPGATVSSAALVTGPTLVVAGAVVASVDSAGAATFGGTGSTSGVVLAVPAAQVAGLVGAVERGAIDLVQDVPGGQP